MGANAITQSLYNLVSRLVLDKDQISKTILLRGNPFASAEFDARFERRTLPAEISGELQSGSDGHCCVGVALIDPSDNAAIWESYKRKK